MGSGRGLRGFSLKLCFVPWEFRLRLGIRDPGVRAEA